MQVGFMPLGIAPLATPEAVTSAAVLAEDLGFHSIWATEHAVVVAEHQSTYPYSPSGRFPVEALQVDYLDPFITLSFAAAKTRRIRIGTGICILPTKNALAMAKTVATLDSLSGGRFDFGVGLGWQKEEFDALGVPWAKRAERTREYIEVMKKLWGGEATQHSGDFCDFQTAYCLPTPVQKPHPPIIIAGEGEAALRRAATLGNGWYGMGLTVDQAVAKLAQLKKFAVEAGRDPDSIHTSACLGMNVVPTADAMMKLHEAGLHQIILGSFSRSFDAFKDEIANLAKHVVEPAARLGS